ncbi:hypothetical protein FB45DRAFT_1089554 [Roridomyces roridus]|uniref:Uncharacterized protein n=1 Tax=Roridomyces roridus TaxID=1738132 RepID=A0AAD7BKH1_9AGAR|nr:hypothetical protein FB45DRAFT_1089554 [Roridomyces roridus]
MSSLVHYAVPQPTEETSVFNLDQTDVNGNDLWQAAEALRNNMLFMGHVLEKTCRAVQKSDINPGAPIRASLYHIGTELERLALSANQTFACMSDLSRASLSPPVPISLVTEALALIDSCITVIQRSTERVHSLCRGNALPRALFSPYNPIPSLYQYLPSDMVPPTVALWYELANFTDVCVTLEGILPAIHTFRCFVQRAVDEQPTRFFEHRETMKTLSKESLGKLESECIGLSVNARHLLFHCQSPGRGEPLFSTIHPRRLYPSTTSARPL